MHVATAIRPGPRWYALKDQSMAYRGLCDSKYAARRGGLREAVDDGENGDIPLLIAEASRPGLDPGPAAEADAGPEDRGRPREGCVRTEKEERFVSEGCAMMRTSAVRDKF